MTKDAWDAYQARFRRLRSKLGLACVVHLSGVTRSTVARWATGQSRPKGLYLDRAITFVEQTEASHLGRDPRRHK